MKEILDIFYHYHLKGDISTTTYKMILQSIEQIEKNENENRIILNAISEEIKLMDQKIFNQYKYPGV